MENVFWTHNLKRRLFWSPALGQCLYCKFSSMCLSNPGLWSVTLSHNQVPRDFHSCPQGEAIWQEDLDLDRITCSIGFPERPDDLIWKLEVRPLVFTCSVKCHRKPFPSYPVLWRRLFPVSPHYLPWIDCLLPPLFSLRLIMAAGAMSLRHPWVGCACVCVCVFCMSLSACLSLGTNIS